MSEEIKKCEDCFYCIRDCLDGCYWCDDPKHADCPCHTCSLETRDSFKLKEGKQIWAITPNLGAYEVPWPMNSGYT